MKILKQPWLEVVFDLTFLFCCDNFIVVIGL